MTTLPVPALLAIQAAAPGGGGLYMLLLQFGLIFAIFYFLMIRPQRKQQAEHQARLRALKRGEEVVTTGGVVGEIVHIVPAMKDGQPAPGMEDRITIRSGDARLIIERGRIARVITSGAAETGKVTT